MARNIAGQRFGKLVAIERGENKNGKTYWWCQCDCGGENSLKLIHTYSLTSGNTKSCDCIRHYIKRLNRSTIQ